MQDQNEQTPATEPSQNVVSLFGDRKIQKKAELATKNENEGTAPESEESFMDVMKRNKMTQDRLRQERLKANKSVLKSYKIKN